MSNTTSSTIDLDRVGVAKPCKADWDKMTGDDRVRHCGDCKLDVYDISSMSRDEAQEFLASRAGAGRTCIRFFRRADGRLLTRDCPVGVRAAWRRVSWAAAALLAGGFAAAAMFAPRGTGIAQATPFRQVLEFVRTAVGAPAAPPPALMGEAACPAPATPAPAPAPVEFKGDYVAPPARR